MTRSHIYDAVFQRSGAADAQTASVNDLTEVVRRFPSNARFQARLAVKQNEAGNSAAARESAKSARTIESINQTWGHRDQYLSPDELESIDRIRQNTPQ